MPERLRVKLARKLGKYEGGAEAQIASISEVGGQGEVLFSTFVPGLGHDQIDSAVKSAYGAWSQLLKKAKIPLVVTGAIAANRILAGLGAGDGGGASPWEDHFLNPNRTYHMDKMMPKQTSNDTAEEQ